MIGGLGEIWTVKANVVRSQMRMEAILLETRVKVILVINRQRIWLNCIHALEL